jgi:hypothetical protein
MAIAFESTKKDQKSATTMRRTGKGDGLQTNIASLQEPREPSYFILLLLKYLTSLVLPILRLPSRLTHIPTSLLSYPSSNFPSIFTYYSVLHHILNMGPKKMLPRLSAAEELQQMQERADENARALRTSTASRLAHGLQQMQEQADDHARSLRLSAAASQATVPFDHMGNANVQMSENATDLTTTMQQPLGMTAPTGFDVDWSGFSTQEFENQSSLTTPTLNNDSPGKWQMAVI